MARPADPRKAAAWQRRLQRFTASGHDGVQVLRSSGRIGRRLPLLAAKARARAA